MAKPSEKLQESDIVRPGEQVAAAIVTQPYDSGPAEAPMNHQLGLVGHFGVVRPLQRKLHKRWRRGSYEAPADLDPALKLEVAGLGVVLAVTDQRLLVVKDKSGGYTDVIAEAPIGDVALATKEGGRKLVRNRAFHVVFPDGRWLIREQIIAAKSLKRGADEFVEAFRAHGGALDDQVA